MAFVFIFMFRILSKQRIIEIFKLLEKYDQKYTYIIMLINWGIKTLCLRIYIFFSNITVFVGESFF